MLALRRASEDIGAGKTVFLDLPEPVLGFTRGENTMCLYNLSPDPVSVQLTEAVTPVLEQSAEVDGTVVTLGGSGFLIGRIV